MTWNYAFTTHIWLFVFTVILLIGLSIFSIRRRKFPGALPFIFGCLTAALWAVGSAMVASAVDIETKIFWIKFQTIWQLPAIIAETGFILEYTWPGRWLTRRNLVLLSIAPLLLLGLILTNNLHHWMWSGLISDGSFTPLPGPGGWFYVTCAFTLGVVEILVFVWLFLRIPQHRWPISIFAASQIAAHLVYVLGLTSIFHDYLPMDVFAITIVFLMYAVALFGFRIFDPVPLARQTVISQMQEGMLVLDLQGRVASLNQAAEEILGVCVPNAIGRPIPELLPMYPPTNGECCGGIDQIEIDMITGLENRYYLVNTSELQDWRGMKIGVLMLLCDITGQKYATAQMIEQQRAQAMLQEREQLARELHDCLGQVFSFVNIQGQTIHRLLKRGDLETADEYIQQLVKVAREADVDIRESILCLRVDLSEHGFFPALEHHLARYEKNYGIRTQLEVSETFGDRAFEQLVEVQLMRILQEALTNIRKHAAARSVRIVFTAMDSMARVTVRDDGQGFDPVHGPAGSGAHVGLRVMRERAEEVGGAVHIVSTPGSGTSIIVEVPLVDQAHTREGSQEVTYIQYERERL